MMALVEGSVVWKEKSAETAVSGAIVQPVACTVPALIIVKKAVAVFPTCTDRLVGNTDAAITVVFGNSVPDNVNVYGPV